MDASFAPAHRSTVPAPRTPRSQPAELGTQEPGARHLADAASIGHGRQAVASDDLHAVLRGFVRDEGDTSRARTSAKVPSGAVEDDRAVERKTAAAKDIGLEVGTRQRPRDAAAAEVAGQEAASALLPGRSLDWQALKGIAGDPDASAQAIREHNELLSTPDGAARYGRWLGEAAGDPEHAALYLRLQASAAQTEEGRAAVQGQLEAIGRSPELAQAQVQVWQRGASTPEGRASLGEAMHAVAQSPGAATAWLGVEAQAATTAGGREALTAYSQQVAASPAAATAHAQVEAQAFRTPEGQQHGVALREAGSTYPSLGMAQAQVDQAAQRAAVQGDATAQQALQQRDAAVAQDAGLAAATVQRDAAVAQAGPEGSTLTQDRLRYEASSPQAASTAQQRDQQASTLPQGQQALDQLQASYASQPELAQAQARVEAQAAAAPASSSAAMDSLPSPAEAAYGAVQPGGELSGTTVAWGGQPAASAPSGSPAAAATAATASEMPPGGSPGTHARAAASTSAALRPSEVAATEPLPRGGGLPSHTLRAPASAEPERQAVSPARSSQADAAARSAVREYPSVPQVRVESGDGGAAPARAALTSVAGGVVEASTQALSGDPVAASSTEVAIGAESLSVASTEPSLAASARQERGAAVPGLLPADVPPPSHEDPVAAVQAPTEGATAVRVLSQATAVDAARVRALTEAEDPGRPTVARERAAAARDDDDTAVREVEDRRRTAPVETQVARNVEAVEAVALFDQERRSKGACKTCGSAYPLPVPCCSSCQTELRETLVSASSTFQRAGYVVGRTVDRVEVTAEARQVLQAGAADVAAMRRPMQHVNLRDLLALHSAPATGYAVAHAA